MLGQFPEAIILAGIGQTPQARKSLKQSGIPVIQTMEMTNTPIDINIGMSQRLEQAMSPPATCLSLAMFMSGKYRRKMIYARSKRIEGYMQAVEEFGAVPMMFQSTSLRVFPSAASC